MGRGAPAPRGATRTHHRSSALAHSSPMLQAALLPLAALAATFRLQLARALLAVQGRLMGGALHPAARSAAQIRSVAMARARAPTAHQARSQPLAAQVALHPQHIHAAQGIPTATAVPMSLHA